MACQHTHRQHQATQVSSSPHILGVCLLDDVALQVEAKKAAELARARAEAKAEASAKAEAKAVFDAFDFRLLCTGLFESDNRHKDTKGIIQTWKLTDATSDECH